MTDLHIEHDLLGEKTVPAERYYGIQTLRALENYQISGIQISHYPVLIQSLAYIKKAAALANRELGLLDPHLSEAIAAAGDQILERKYLDEFVVDVTLVEEMQVLQRALADKGVEFAGVIKMGRTQLQDAVPGLLPDFITLEHENMALFVRKFL